MDGKGDNKTIQDIVIQDGVLFIGGQDIQWDAERNTVELDGRYTAVELKAIVSWIQSKEVK